MGEAQGKKVFPPPLRPRRSRHSRPWPDQAIRGHVTRAGRTALREKTWRESSNTHKRPPASGEGKETLACRWASLKSRHLVTPCPMASYRSRTVTTPQCYRGPSTSPLEWSCVGTSKIGSRLEIAHGGSSALPGQPRQRIKRYHGSGNALSGIGRGAESCAPRPCLP
jgi:hypothetical protein